MRFLSIKDIWQNESNRSSASVPLKNLRENLGLSICLVLMLFVSATCVWHMVPNGSIKKMLFAMYFKTRLCVGLSVLCVVHFIIRILSIPQLLAVFDCASSSHHKGKCQANFPASYEFSKELLQDLSLGHCPGIMQNSDSSVSRRAELVTHAKRLLCIIPWRLPQSMIAMSGNCPTYVNCLHCWVEFWYKSCIAAQMDLSVCLSICFSSHKFGRCKIMGLSHFDRKMLIIRVIASSPSSSIA